MDVVDEHDQQPVRLGGREKLGDRVARLLGGHRPLGEPEQLRILVRDALASLVERVLVADAREVAQHLSDRPVGDALAVREAGAACDPRPLADAVEELVREPGLADAGVADDRDEAAATLRPDLVELGLEQRELVPAADERRGGAAGDRAVRGRLEQPVSDQRLGLPLRLNRRDGLDDDGSSDEPVGRLAEQDLARRGGLLEPGSDVDRVAEHDGVAGREHLAPSSVAGDDLARVDSDPHRDPRVEPRLQLDVQRGDPLLDLQRRPARAQRVVLVRLGHPEHPDDGVADELLDRAAVSLERCPRRVEVRAHQVEDCLRVGALGHPRRAREVAEHRGHEPAPLDARAVSAQSRRRRRTCGRQGSRWHTPRTSARSDPTPTRERRRSRRRCTECRRPDKPRCS